MHSFPIPADRRREIRPHVGAALTASRAGKARLNVGEPEIIGPGVGPARRPSSWRLGSSSK